MTRRLLKAALDFEPQAFACEVVNDHQRADLSAARQRVVHEVQGPPLVACADWRDRVAADIPDITFLARSDLQPELAVKAAKTMPDDGRRFTPK